MFWQKRYIMKDLKSATIRQRVHQVIFKYVLMCLSLPKMGQWWNYIMKNVYYIHRTFSGSQYYSLMKCILEARKVGVESYLSIFRGVHSESLWRELILLHYLCEIQSKYEKKKSLHTNSLFCDILCFSLRARLYRRG